MKMAGVCLIAQDIRNLASFYRQLFEEEGCWEGEEHVTFRETGLAVFSARGMEEMAPGATKGTGSGRAVLSFDVADVDALLDKLLKLHAQIVKPAQNHPWGSRSLWIKDPEGNILSLKSPVK